MHSLYESHAFGHDSFSDIDQKENCNRDEGYNLGSAFVKIHESFMTICGFMPSTYSYK